MKEYALAIAREINVNTELKAEIYAKEMPDGSKQYGVTIKAEGSHVAPTIYVDSFYKREMPVDIAARELLKVYDANKVDDVNMDWYLDFEKVKEKLFVKMLPATYECDVFRSAKAYGFEDLILVPNVKVEVEGMDGAIRVTKSHMEKWGVTKREVMDAAIRNTKKEEAYIESLAGFMSSITPFEFDIPKGPIIVSNNEKTNGASAIPGLLNGLKKTNKNGFYVIPSSIHELLVIPAEGACGHTKESLDHMVREVNMTLNPTEVLASHAYQF